MTAFLTKAGALEDLSLLENAKPAKTDGIFYYCDDVYEYRWYGSMQRFLRGSKSTPEVHVSPSYDCVPAVRMYKQHGQIPATSMLKLCVLDTELTRRYIEATALHSIIHNPSSHLEVFTTDDGRGRGLRAMGDLPPHCFLTEFTGLRVFERFLPKDYHSAYLISLDRFSIDTPEPLRGLAHMANSPVGLWSQNGSIQTYNCIFDHCPVTNRVYLVTVKPVLRGEELLCDYGKRYYRLLASIYREMGETKRLERWVQEYNGRVLPHPHRRLQRAYLCRQAFRK